MVSASAGTAIGRLEWVWDPLIENIEAAVCPECRHPTFEFGVTRQGRLVCLTCAAAPKDRARPARRQALKHGGREDSLVSGQASSSLTTRPWTSVRRKSRPA